MSRHCDALDAQFDGLMNDSGIAQQLKKDYTEFYTMLADLTGFPVSHFDAPLNIDHVRDVLFCEASLLCCGLNTVLHFISQQCIVHLNKVALFWSWAKVVIVDSKQYFYYYYVFEGRGITISNNCTNHRNNRLFQLY